MHCIVLYCRAGFEKDAGLEMQTLAAGAGCYGYFKAKQGQGWVEFYGNNPSELAALIKDIAFKQLVFVRQWFLSVAHLQELDPNNRIAALQTVATKLPMSSGLRVEHADTNAGKELSKLCRKFSVPLRRELKSLNVYDEQRRSATEVMVFFTSSVSCHVGYAFSKNMSDLPLGIMRLKQPKQAPSRSTLKLDEAFLTFIPEAEREARLAAGLNAVDLGACPGGWTYQLVKRGMFVQAIDNGAMADSLMETGQVRHFEADGFRYEPKKKNVYWLVCDMIEKPNRVARLMASWVANNWCQEAMFNLKLPMKKRYEALQECLELIKTDLKAAQIHNYECRVKQLYHDRDEVTVLLRKLQAQQR